MPAPRAKKPVKAQATPVEIEERLHTPEPAEPAPSTITAAQKQQLIDHLQNEVTGRARKLRAQYALHARSLRDRLEMRINRIPHNLRTMNLEELIDRYAEGLEQPTSRPLPTLPAKAPIHSTRTLPKHPVNVLPGPPIAPSRGTKRPSDNISTISDKENIHADLDMPKKRAKTALGQQAGGPTGARTATGPTRPLNPAQVLSPKSHNSRTLPHSPIRPAGSPTRSLLARPVSPVKPLLTVAPLAAASAKPKAPSRAASKQTAATTTSATGSTRGRGKAATTKAAAAAVVVPAKSGRSRAASHTSSTSDASAVTTIVKKAAPAKKGVAGKIASLAGAGAKRVVTKKPVPVPAPSANPTGRSLRSRK